MVTRSRRARIVPRRTRRKGFRGFTSGDSISRPTPATVPRRLGNPIRRWSGERSARPRSSRSRRIASSMARTSNRFTNTSTRNSRSAIEDRTRVGAPPAISMPKVSPADSDRSVRNCRSVASPALRPPEASTRVSSPPESQKSLSWEGSMMTHASHTLPSSHSRCRIVRARSVEGSKRRLSSPSARSITSSSTHRLARDADRKQLFARPELLGRELEGLEHAQAQLPLEVHTPDKHRTPWEHNSDGARLRAQGSGLKQDLRVSGRRFCPEP